MAAPKDLQLAEWNVMMDSFDKESDRGAAVLAGGFTEHYLGNYLGLLVHDSKVGEELFGATGPLSSFSQRISVAYAFDFITKELYSDLNVVRRIRNHFAHHPLEVSFSSNDVVQLARKLTTIQMARDSQPENEAMLYRRAYLFACSSFCGYAYTMLVHKYKRIEGYKASPKQQ
jgi:hypothetical protein